MNSKNKTILITSAVAVAVGVGVILLIKNRSNLKQRGRQLLQVCNVNPLKFREIQIVNNIDEATEIVRRLKNDCQDSVKALGFDCEWVTVGGKRRPVSMLQLSSHTGLCALFRLCNMKVIPADLRELLEDETILKVGVAPNDDASHLAHDYSVGVACTVDLRYLADLVDCKGESLAKMSQEHLNITLDKNWRVSCSDWEAKELSEKQIDYASKDALVAIELFKKFVDKIEPIYPWSNSQQTYANVTNTIHKYIDLKYKPTRKSADSNNLDEKTGLLKPKSGSKEPKRSFATRASPLYDNCYMQAPDGELLCTCDKRKAEWYVQKDLATLVKVDPFTVRLNFEPAGRAVGQVGKYYQQVKENMCVVCGRRESYVRKNVVPREYRKFFPTILKDHTSHDILLLCNHCHQISDITDLKMRMHLTELCNAPMSTQEGGKKSSENQELKIIRNAARALFYNGEKIPEDRKKELRDRLKHCLPDPTAEEVPLEILQELCYMNITQEYQDYMSHAERVVQYFTKNGGLVELEKLWRQHFLDTMKPNYLPNLWSVHHNVERLEIRADEGRCTKDDLTVAGLNPSMLATSPVKSNPIIVEERMVSPKKVVPSASTPRAAAPIPVDEIDEISETDSSSTLTKNEEPSTKEDDFASIYQSPEGSQYYSNSTLASWKSSRSSYYDANQSDSDTASFKSFDTDDQTIRDYDSDQDSDSTLSQNSMALP